MTINHEAHILRNEQEGSGPYEEEFDSWVRFGKIRDEKAGTNLARLRFGHLKLRFPEASVLDIVVWATGMGSLQLYAFSLLLLY